MLRYLLSFVLIIGLMACHEETSHKQKPQLTSGVVSYLSPNGSNVEKSLSLEQLHLLSAWIEKHSTGWGYCLANVPSIVTFSLSLKYANGKSNSLNLHSGRWDKTMETSHLEGSNMSDQPCALQTFTEQDLIELRTLLSIERE
jgi:hypothetical protein